MARSREFTEQIQALKRFPGMSWSRSVTKWSGQSPSRLSLRYISPHASIGAGISNSIANPNEWYAYLDGRNPRFGAAHIGGYDRVAAVESDFPGIGAWLNHLIWEALDPRLGESGLRHLRCRLPFRARRLLVTSPFEPEETRFLAEIADEVLAHLIALRSPGAFAALLMLMHEAKLSGFPQLHIQYAAAVVRMLPFMLQHPVLSTVSAELTAYLEAYCLSIPSDPISDSVSISEPSNANATLEKHLVTSIESSRPLSSEAVVAALRPLDLADLTIPEDSDSDELLDVYLLEPDEALPILTGEALGGADCIGFGLDTQSDVQVLVLDGVPARAANYLVEMIGVGHAEIDAIFAAAGDPNEAAPRSEAGKLRRNSSQSVIDIARVCARLMYHFSSRASAFAWLRLPNVELGSRCPNQLLPEPTGIARLADIVTKLEQGEID